MNKKDYRHGPFWRYERDKSTIYAIKSSGKLRGKPPRGSDIPAVKAYSGGAQIQGNITFLTKVAPDKGSFPSSPKWRSSGRPPGEVELINVEGQEFVQIDVFVIDPTDDRRVADKGAPNGVERRKVLEGE